MLCKAILKNLIHGLHVILQLWQVIYEGCVRVLVCLFYALDVMLCWAQIAIPYSSYTMSCSVRRLMIILHRRVLSVPLVAAPIEVFLRDVFFLISMAICTHLPVFHVKY